MADETFETKLQQLNQIVTNLENGQVSLEQAIAEFKQGMALSKQLENTLANAEKAVTQIMNDNNEEQPFQANNGDEQ